MRQRTQDSHGQDPRHSHGHVDSPPPTSLRGRGVLVALVIVMVSATLTGLVLLRPPSIEIPEEARTGTDRIQGTITAVEQVSCGESLPGADGADEPESVALAPAPQCMQVSVRIDEGPEAGETFTTITGGRGFDRVGRGVVLFRGTDPDIPPEALYQLADVQRGVPLLALGGIFLVAILALGRLRGALAVAGLCVSLLVLVKFLVPALIAGRPPVLTAVVGAAAVMVAVLLLAHGPSVRTATAMVGTASALALTVLLATVFTEFAGLTGLTSDDAAYVEALFGSIDLRGLLLAGIVIGALGILDDVTVTQVSTVYELRAADPSMSRGQLYAAALRVGRDHIASTVNTLLLAYAGASMPLLVLFSTSGTGFVDTVTNGVVAEEVVRTLVGSVGLIAAVPITTALAAAMCPPQVCAPAVTAGGSETGSRRFLDDAAWAARAGQRDVDQDD